MNVVKRGEISGGLDLITHFYSYADAGHLAAARIIHLLDPKMVLAFVMASGFIADTSSLPFVVSNLVNIMSADYFGIGFAEYAARMVLPTLFSVGASLVVLFLYFRQNIPKQVDLTQLKSPHEAIRDQKLFRLSWPILAVLLIGFFISETIHKPVFLIITGAALIFCLAAKNSPAIQMRRIVKEAPWVVVIFSIGMYVCDVKVVRLIDLPAERKGQRAFCLPFFPTEAWNSTRFYRKK